MSTLLWELYLVVPWSDRKELLTAIRQYDRISNELRAVRLNAVDAGNGTKPAAERTRADKKQDDDEDILKGEYGQAGLLSSIVTMCGYPRWKKTVDDDE